MTNINDHSNGSDEDIWSKHLDSILKTYLLLKTSLKPITRITSGYIILDKNINLLNINDLFQKIIYSLQVITRSPLKYLIGKW